MLVYQRVSLKKLHPADSASGWVSSVPRVPRSRHRPRGSAAHGRGRSAAGAARRNACCDASCIGSAHSPRVLNAKWEEHIPWGNHGTHIKTTCRKNAAPFFKRKDADDWFKRHVLAAVSIYSIGAVGTSPKMDMILHLLFCRLIVCGFKNCVLPFGWLMVSSSSISWGLKLSARYVAKGCP